METTHTSLELSKKLQENWFKEYNRKMRISFNKKDFSLSDVSIWAMNVGWYPAYDILNDLCVKYANEIFGDLNTLICNTIFCLIKQWKKQEAEDYLREHCLFNLKNK